MRTMLFLLISVLLFSCASDDPPVNPNLETNAKFSIDQLSVTEGSSDKSIFVNLRLSKVADQTVTVVLETVDQTAEEGADYLGFENEEIIFEVGDVQSSVQVTIVGDEEAEGDEAFLIRVKSIDGADISTNEVVITIENDDQDFTITIPDSGFSTPEEYTGWDIFWRDEFDADVLNEEDWTFETGNGNWGWGNNELEFYRKQNTQLVDGNLVIQARKETFNGFDYTSSRIKTQNKVDFTFGRVDIRAVIPEGQGIWPALWMLGSNFGNIGWPRCGEIDIMELIGHQPSTVHGTVHYPDPNGDRLQNTKHRNLTSGKFSDEFHVFSLIWEDDSIEWLVDGQKFHSVSRASLGTQNPYPFNDDFFFIFNVAVGGTWPGSPDATTVFPQNMIVDYIRVFKKQ